MRYSDIEKLMNLQFFADDDGEDGAQRSDQTGAAGAGSDRGYSFEQVEQMAAARAKRAETAALKNYFARQGMSEDEIKNAIDEYKVRKSESESDMVSSLTKERDEALSKLRDVQNSAYLTKKGVSGEDLDYVLFKVNAASNGADDFEKAADKYLKDNPRFVGTYRVSTGASGSGSGGAANVNDMINAAIRRRIR